MNINKLIQPVHPGEILLKEFLEPMGISQYRLAKDINVPARRINEAKGSSLFMNVLLKSIAQVYLRTIFQP